MRVIKWFLGLLFLALLAFGFVLFEALDSSPLVDRSETISPTAVTQARRLFTSNDPRLLQHGGERQVAIPTPLIDEALNYLASRILQARGTLLMSEDTAEIRITRRIPMASVPLYLNLRATFDESEGAPRIASGYVGNLTIPGSVMEFALSAAIGHSDHDREWILARSAIRRLAFEPARQAIVVHFEWEPAMLDRARAIALKPEDWLRIQVAQTNLTILLDHKPLRTTIALPSLLKPLLTATGDHPREQRRAALLVLATYLAEKNLTALIPEARNWPRPRSVKLTLLNRYDSAQHFAVSAALAAWGGEPLADAIGLDKEIDDSRHGSGFSFADLVADRAGSRFGELVARNADLLDKALLDPLANFDLAPSLKGFPEYLSEREFKRQYGGPGQPAYQQVVAEIERRLAALPLYR